MQKNYGEEVTEKLRDEEEEEKRFEFYEEKIKDDLLPVEHDLPTYDEKTEIAGVVGYEKHEDKIVVRYRKERKPQRTLRTDALVDMIADRVAERIK